VKNDRKTYIADRLPVPLDGIPKSGTCQTDERTSGRSGSQVMTPKGVNEPMSSDPPKVHSTRLIEYDDWMRQEEKKYSQLLTELKKSRWFIRSSPHKSNVQASILQFDVDKPHRGEPPNAMRDVGRMMDEPMSTELEATRLTDDEIRYGCGITMEQALLGYDKPPVLDDDSCLGRTSTQESIAFQYTLSVRGQNISRSPMMEAVPTGRSKLPDPGGSKTVNRLWLNVGESYSKFSGCDSTAAINSAGPEDSRRIENLYPGSRWCKSVMPTQWDSVMVESVRLVLQRWRGVCSFSQTMRSNWSGEKHNNVFPLCPKKRSRPGE
jgi:hypothetical protein